MVQRLGHTNSGLYHNEIRLQLAKLSFKGILFAASKEELRVIDKRRLTADYICPIA